MTAAILVASAVPTLPQAPPLRKRESRHTPRRRSKQGNHFGQVQHHYSRRGANSCNCTCTNSNDSGGSEESRSAQRISDGPRAQVRTGSGVELGDGTGNSGATRSCENGCQERLEPVMSHSPKGRHVERPPTPEPNKAELPEPDNAPALDKADRPDHAPYTKQKAELRAYTKQKADLLGSSRSYPWQHRRQQRTVTPVLQALTRPDPEGRKETSHHCNHHDYDRSTGGKCSGNTDRVEGERGGNADCN